jgi:hypothetical protein
MDDCHFSYIPKLKKRKTLLWSSYCLYRRRAVLEAIPQGWDHEFPGTEKCRTAEMEPALLPMYRRRACLEAITT